MKTNVIEINTLANLDVCDLGLMLTAYERYGACTRDDLIEMLADELTVDTGIISAYNEYCASNRYDYDYIYDMAEFEELELSGLTPLQAFELAYQNDTFNMCDDFYSYNGNGNLVSYSESRLLGILSDDDSFKKWYVEHYLINELDDDEIDAIIEHCNDLLRQGF